MSHANLVSIAVATETLEVSDSALCVSAKYSDYYIKAEGKKKGAMFDLQGYLKHEDLKVELIEKIKLFVEYMHHIEGWSYTKIAKHSNMQVSALHLLSFGYKRALEMLARFRYNYPFHLVRFDLYYGYKVAKGMEKYVTKSN